MNEKKNIDRLFQEKFKDFEVTPPDFVWENIRSGLEEKKKRRIIPFWFKFSGVAAILVVGIFILGTYLNNNENNSNPVVIDIQDKNPDGSKRITPTDKPIRQGQNVNEAVAVENEPAGSAVKIKDATVPALQQERANTASDLKRNNAVSGAVAKNDKSEEPGSRQKSNSTGARNSTGTNGNNTAVAQNNIRSTENNSASNSIANDTGNNAVAGNVKNKENSIGNGNEPLQGNENIIITEHGVAENTTVQDNAAPDNNAAERNNNDNISIDNNAILPQDIKAGQEIAQTEAAVDTTLVAEPENELEILRDKLNSKEKEEEEAVAENSRKGKWNIKPQMAPLFFNTASEGSPINANLAANSKDFDNDLSYGVGLDYAITDRISIRSGINTVNMRYSTNDVEFYASLNNNEQFSSVVAPSGQNANLVVNPAGGVEATDNLRTQTFDGALVQKIGFVEVPLEMSYKLVNRKFGVDLIGGVSTLFLSDNNISVVSGQGYSSDMGEARNLNNVSFSTNVGIGFKYRIFESFEASFEPMFKYQLNTFSNNSGNFKPYFIGLYSGISFSF